MISAASQAKPDQPRGRMGILLSALLVVLVLAAAILANSMTKEISRDEQMYCTGGVLLGQGQLIYRDFAYPSQLPYHPLLLAALYRLFSTTHYLLTARLVSVICDVLVMLSIMGIYRSVLGAFRREGLVLGLAAAALYVFNPLVDYAAGYAWNHDGVILCVVLSFWIFITTDFQHRSRYWRGAAMGALLTLATCTRITTAPVELLFLAAVVAGAKGSVRDRMRAALPFSLAGLVVLAWPIWVVAQAPQAFALNLLQIPALYGRWLHEIGMAYSKAALVIASLTMPGYLALLVVSGYLLWTSWRRRDALETRHKAHATLAALLPAFFFVIALVPPTMWLQYMAVPVPFLVIALAYPLAHLRRQTAKAKGMRPFAMACGVVAIGATVTVLGNLLVLQRLPFALVPERWVPVELHRTARDIAAQTPDAGPVLTLGPLYALEGGRDIYPELACGSIIYRVADQMSAEQRRLTHTIGPAALERMLAQRPAVAVLVGVEPSEFAFLEEPLRKAIPADWRRETYEDGLQVYTRP